MSSLASCASTGVQMSRRGLLRWGTAGAMVALLAPSLGACAAPPAAVVTGGVAPERVSAYRSLVLTAIPVVEDLWGINAVPLPVRMDLPATIAAWSKATGHEPDQRGYAASTVRRPGATARDESTGQDGSNDVRIVMHPDAWDELTPEGRLGVIVHEVTHLAMGTRTGAPWWLGEGVAEYTAHRTSSRSLQEIAGSAWDPIVSKTPQSWPTPNLEQPWQGYASAWLACVFITQTAGEDGLLTLYDSVSEGRSLDEACRTNMGRGEADLRMQWARWLSEQ